jgi:tellurite resistance protein
MIWLSNSTLARLRDQLRLRGQRPSIVASSNVSRHVAPDVAEAMNLVAEYGPLCEAMYLMMSADGAVTEDEHEVLRGALRNLSGDTLRTAQIDSLFESASSNVEQQGRDKRMEEITHALREDPARAEVAFVLAAAIAFADNAIADQENETLNTLAEELGIDEAKANELLDSVESDLTGGATERGPTPGIGGGGPK